MEFLSELYISSNFCILYKSIQVQIPPWTTSTISHSQPRTPSTQVKISIWPSTPLTSENLPLSVHNLFPFSLSFSGWIFPTVLAALEDPCACVGPSWREHPGHWGWWPDQQAGRLEHAEYGVRDCDAGALPCRAWPHRPASGPLSPRLRRGLFSRLPVSVWVSSWRGKGSESQHCLAVMAFFPPMSFIHPLPVSLAVTYRQRERETVLSVALFLSLSVYFSLLHNI